MIRLGSIPGLAALVMGDSILLRESLTSGSASESFDLTVHDQLCLSRFTHMTSRKALLESLARAKAEQA